MAQRAAYTVVIVVVAWFADGVSTYYGGGAVVAVGFVGVEVDFAEQFLLMVLESNVSIREGETFSWIGAYFELADHGRKSTAKIRGQRLSEKSLVRVLGLE